MVFYDEWFVKVEQEDNITTQTESEISVKAGLEDLDIEDTFLAVIKMDFFKRSVVNLIIIIVKKLADKEDRLILI